MFARGIEQRGEEGGGAAHLGLHLQPFEAEHDRGAMLADARGEPRDLALGMSAASIDDMAEAARPA